MESVDLLYLAHQFLALASLELRLTFLVIIF